MTKYVKLETAIDAVNDVYYDTPDINLSADKLEAALRGIPAADVAPVVHGRWVVRFDGPYKRRRCYCSHCGKHSGVGGIAKNQEKPYCPNCGARMDGDSNAFD